MLMLWKCYAHCSSMDTVLICAQLEEEPASTVVPMGIFIYSLDWSGLDCSGLDSPILSVGQKIGILIHLLMLLG